MKGKRGTTEGEGLNEWTEKEEKEKKNVEMRVWPERERERGIDKVRTNKILVFLFTILLQCNSTFRITL